jgi:hypothetical protein
VGSKQLTVRDALNMALDEELARDERVNSPPSFVASDIFEANREIIYLDDCKEVAISLLFF